MVMITPFHQVVKEEVVESCIIDDPDMEIQVFIAIVVTSLCQSQTNL